MSERLGVAHGIATTNGTCALHVALLVAGVQADDEVIMPALTFIAPANAIRYAGAWPVFIDADASTFQMSIPAVADFLHRECRREPGDVRNKRTGRRVRAIVPVHVLGHPVDLDPLLAIAAEFGLPVVEDATEALGATYKGAVVGGSGRLSCLSFNGNKLLTTGGGGMILTNDPREAQRARYLTTQAKDDAIAFVHGAVGYNYRLSNVLAAIGVAQLERLDAHLADKRRIADRYHAELASVDGVSTMPEARWARSALWLYTILLDAGIDRDAVLQTLSAEGIQTRPLWQALHQSPAHRDAERRECPVAEDLVARSLSLPSSVGLSEQDQTRVIGALKRAVKEQAALERR
jgi:perosamine synthetase